MLRHGRVMVITEVVAEGSDIPFRSGRALAALTRYHVCGVIMTCFVFPAAFGAKLACS